MTAHQQTPQFIRLKLIGFKAVAFQISEQLFLAQAGVIFLVVSQIQLARVGEKLVTETAAGAASDHTNHVWAVGQGHFHEDVTGVRGKVEPSRLFEAVFAEAHVRHACQNWEL